MKYLFFCSLFIVSIQQGMAQGCSDAGFCSLGALKDASFEHSKKNTLDFGSNVGFGEQNTFTVNPYIQYNRKITDRFSVAGKLTATYANGFLGSAFNFGDFYGLATYKASKQGAANSFRILAGFKAPLTTANSKNDNGKPLPLDYQSSIGTFDFIGGINYILKEKLEIDAAVQAPVVQINKNTFFPDEYTDARISNFAPTNNFRRKTDVLLRAGYYIKLSPSFIVKPNLLGIYHLGKDSYEDRLGRRSIIEGTEGFTLNGAIVLAKQLKKGGRLELIAATPFTVRKVRADGLTRKAAFNLQYSIPF